jgi:hypothetical protein
MARTFAKSIRGVSRGEGHDDMNAIELCLRAACGPRLQDGRGRVSPWGKGEMNHYVEIRPRQVHMEWPSVMSLGGNRYKALNRGFEHLSAVTVETNFIWMPKKEFWFSRYARGCTH